MRAVVETSHRRVQRRADGKTARQASIILPSGWGPANPPAPAPLVISPHARNNLCWDNAVSYRQNLSGDGSFILVCRTVSAAPTSKRAIRSISR